MEEGKEKEKILEVQQHQYFLKCKLSSESQEQCGRTPTRLTPGIPLPLPLDDQQTHQLPCGLGFSHLQLIVQCYALHIPPKPEQI